MTKRARVSVGAVIAAALVLSAGCGKKDDPVLPQESSTAAPSPSTAPSSGPAAVHPKDEKAMLAAYTGGLMAYAEAAETGNTNHPGIHQNFTGDALKRIVSGLISMRTRGVHSEGRPVLAPWVTSATPGLDNAAKAEIADCSDTSSWLQHNKDGSVVSGDKGGRKAVVATVVLENGAWKVSDFTFKAIGTC